VAQEHDNSIIASGLDEVLIENGRVINVNMRRWTADVRTEVNQTLFLDIQWGNPYLHFAQGEGIFAMAEVGAKCMVCRPSDSPPFIMCFITTFERNQSAESDDSQGERDLQEGQEQSNANVSFAAGRPDLQQGDMMLRGRDGNQIWLRRGGVLELGATAVSKRIYIPLLNYIRDFCENYALQTFGGDMSWVVKRVEDDPDGDAKALFTLAAKDGAQDDKGTVALRIGHIDDEDRLSLLIKPDAINMETFEVDGGALFELTIDKEGSVEITGKKDATITIEGDLSQTVQGSATYEFQGGQTVNVTGDQETSVSGGHKVTAANSEENISGGKVVNSPSIDLGGTGGEPAAKSITLATWLGTHTHPPTGGPPVAPPPPFGATTTKVK
jgi:hypothetical protein